MDYFQGVVTEFLRAKRSVFVNTECLLQLDSGNVPAKGRHWYCDVLAVDLSTPAGYLCDVTYSTTLQTLVARLKAWKEHWPSTRIALTRDCDLPQSWEVQPWVFIPKRSYALFQSKMTAIGASGNPSSAMPEPRVTYLESVAPWNYLDGNRTSDELATEA